MNKKYLFIDIDGTITNDKGIITKSTMRAIKKYHDVVLTTGRIRKNVKSLCDELGLKYFISSYGAELYDNENNKVIYNITIEESTMECIIDACLKVGAQLLVSIDNDEVLITESNKAENLKNVKQCMVKGSIEQLNNVRKYINEVKNITFQKENGYEYGYYWFSIMNAKVSKGKSIDYLLKLLKIDKKDTISIGNDSNDLSMFESTLSRVAVGNSCEELKRHATIIIGNNNDNSVKKYIDMLTK